MGARDTELERGDVRGTFRCVYQSSILYNMVPLICAIKYRPCKEFNILAGSMLMPNIRICTDGGGSHLHLRVGLDPARDATRPSGEPTAITSIGLATYSRFRGPRLHPYPYVPSPPPLPRWPSIEDDGQTVSLSPSSLLDGRSTRALSRSRRVGRPALEKSLWQACRALGSFRTSSSVILRLRARVAVFRKISS